MCPVQSVTDIPVHSPQRSLLLLVFRALRGVPAGMGGGGRRSRPQQGRDSSLHSCALDVFWRYGSAIFEES